MIRLNNKGAGEIFKKLEELKEKVWIKEADDKASYNPSTNTISWDSRIGVYTDNGTALSPTTVLNHEGDHGLDHLNNGNEHLSTTPDSQYDISEEKKVITGSEQTTAKKLGEIKEGEVTRNNHKGQPFEVASSTSTEDKNSIVVKPKTN